MTEKQGWYGLKHDPGNKIVEYVKEKVLGCAETYKQYIDGKDFLVLYQKESDYVTTIMSTYGLGVQWITQLSAQFLENGRASNMWNQYHSNIKVNNGLSI